MFYCEECRIQESWPETLDVKSQGPCEVCGETRRCHNTKTALLLDPARYQQVEIGLRHKGGGRVLELIRDDTADPDEVERAMQEFIDKTGASL